MSLATKQNTSYQATGEEAMIALGKRLAEQLTFPMQVHLIGDLGMGKTTLAKGIVAGLGNDHSVTSPTFSIVEEYVVHNVGKIAEENAEKNAEKKAIIYHLDLYRLTGFDELEAIGWRDMLSDDALLLIEWPERAAGQLGQADLIITITPSSMDDSQIGRDIKLLWSTINA